ncbi:hypothetical protein BC351_28915 [Paenibacillus ferrarius]|uniref:Transposase-like Mu C-terminal domain-containing protein n=1 Tax=Paenibacillus ferrarius TaxID=1469647 RepID=A0A1V4HI03_9BACL|nr:Mu transposase C-terminal domain-containing protein [Paenibacillus ferrarius]OPH56192.1 hypothetical protein BC351_28915 [Paenibacillus ferrarius]
MKYIELAKVTEKGILLKSNYYSCPEAISRKWFEIARKRGEWKIVTVYDPNDLTCIHIYDDQDWLICNMIYFNEISSVKLRRYFNSIQKLKEQRNVVRKLNEHA